MNGKKIRVISIIVVSFVFLLLYVFVWRGYDKYVWLNIVVGEQGIEDVRLTEQRRPLGGKPLFRGEEYTEFSISWQQSYVDESCGFFLPEYVDLSDVYVMVSGGGASAGAFLDGIPLEENTVRHLGEMEEGEHILSVNGKAQKLHVMRGASIPTVWIDTEDGIEYIHDSRSHCTAAEMKVFSDKGELQYSGEIESMQGRGNSSWSTIKRSYGIKLTNAASLLNMTSGKSWTLIGGGYDVTGLRNKIFYDMAVECGLDNAIDCEWINLYIDGRFFGCYLLTEKITVASGRLEIGDLEKRTEQENEEPLDFYPYYEFEENGKQWTGYSVPHQPSDMSGGYLLEIEDYEQRFITETSRFTTNQGYRVVVKSPDCATLEQVGYISGFVQEFEDALYSPDGYNSLGKHYTDYIDMESFVQRYLIDEISKNLDAGYSSYFFYKPQREDKLYAGPVWDYDTGLGNNRGWGSNEVLKDPEGMYVNTDNWSKQLWAQTDFREVSYKIFQKKFLPYLEDLLEYKLEQYAETIQASAAMEQIYYGGEDWEEEVSKMRDFLEKRTVYLEKVLQ